jgi:hypothetical protein
MSFFSRGSHGRGNKGRGNWNRGPRRPRFSIHFDADSQELGQLFQAMDFSIGLGKEWSNLGLKGLPSKFRKPPVFLCPLMSHCNPRFLKMTDGKILSTQTVSQHRGWPNLSLPTPPPVNNQIFQATPAHSPVQSSHASKRLKTEARHALDKGKAIAAPSSPSNGSEKSMSSRMHLRDDCSHVINEIRPKGSAQPKENSGKSKGDNNNQGKIASQSGKYGF